METISSFKTVFEKAAYGSNYAKTFEDFLSMCICAFTQNYHTRLSYYEDEYLSITLPYKANKTLNYFPELLGILIMYMENHLEDSQGNDLLGEFYQQEISNGRNGQFFTPFNISHMMAQMTRGEETKSVNVLDPCCGSGRMLMAFGKGAKFRHGYYGVDIDPVCVKMTAINLLLNGLAGEVICADALARDDFRFGYKISFFPLGIFKIETKEASVIWQTNQKPFPSVTDKSEIPKQRNFPETVVKEGILEQGQLTLF